MTTVGIPAEIKDQERRVSLVPTSVAAVATQASEVRVQTGAGNGAGFSDDDYIAAGATIVPTAEDAWAADVVVKVKEPQPSEFRFFHEDLTLFTYLHLAAEPELTAALVKTGVESYAYETLEDRGALPLLAPMSEVAGRAAVLHAAVLLGRGSGKLIGGSAGVPPANSLVIGLGISGTVAAHGLAGLDSHVIGVDVDLDRLRGAAASGTVHSTLGSEPAAIADAVVDADIVIGAALVPGARAPIVVTEEHVAAMRPGSVIVDLAIDQGGCVATARPTSHSEPTYVVHGVTHYCVTNVPGQFPQTASRALSAAVSPRLNLLLSDRHAEGLRGALNVAGHQIVHPAVADAFPALPSGTA